LDPKNAYGYAFRGRAYVFQSEYDRALTDFTRQIEIDPSDPEAYRARCAAYAGKRDNDAALADNNRAIELTKRRLESSGLRPQ
jgi:tetratricopeptide (TPR) repeat protein